MNISGAELCRTGLTKNTLSSYANLLTQFYPSPSRLMMLMDPLLMVGILGKCINAYKDKNYIASLPR